MTPALRFDLLQINGEFEDPSDYRPSDPKNLWFGFTLGIGEIGSQGTDNFYGTFATEQAMKRDREAIKKHCRFTSNNVIVMKAYSYETFLSKLEEIVTQCDSHSYDRSLPKLRKFFGWEFDRRR